MNWLCNTVLPISIALNGVILGLGMLWLHHRGGVRFLQQTLMRRQSRRSSINLCHFYLHRQRQFEHLAIESDAIVFLGDSLTQEAEWSEWFPQFNIKNRGISGDTTRGLIDRLAPILDAKPQQLFLMIGINDLLNEHRSSQSVAQSYQHILALLQNQTPTTEVLIQSVLPINSTLCGKQVGTEINKLNQALKTIAARQGYRYIDLFFLFADAQNQLSSEYTLDGIHLNGHGYRLWAQQLQPYLTT